MNEIMENPTGSGLRETRTLEIVAAEIRSYTWSMLANIIEIGRRLTEAKEMLPHGEFMTWCTENFGYSKSQTNNFMRLYVAYGSEQNSMFGAELNRQTFGTLNYSKALALLALPSAEEREEFIETHDVESMTTRELQQALKEKTEAEERARTAEKQLDNLRNDREGTERALADAREKIRELAKLNKELESRPVEVAVQRDEQAIADAVKEAREKAEAENERVQEGLKKQLSDAEKKQKALQEKLQKTERDLTVKEAELKGMENRGTAEVERATAKLKTELEQARRQLKTSAADVTAFGIHFNSLQNVFGSMMAELKRVKERDGETGEKLSAAVRELLEYFRKETG